jgi:hypothetical protein
LSTGFGPIILNDIVPNDARLSRIIPKSKITIESSTITTIIDLVFDNRPFGLRYDRITRTWKIVFEQNLNVSNLFSLGKAGDRSNQKLDASWLILFTPDDEFYTVNSRKLRYIFESDQQIRFYYDSSDKIYDTRTNTVAKDKIKVLSINTNPTSPGGTSPFTFDRDWAILKEYSGLDGYIDTKKIEITFTDTDEDSVVDNPDIFNDIVNPPSVTEIDPAVLEKKYIVQEKYTIGDRQEDYRYIYNNLTNPIVVILPSETSVTSFSQYVEAQHFYFIDTDVVKKLDKVACVPYSFSPS